MINAWAKSDRSGRHDGPDKNRGWFWNRIDRLRRFDIVNIDGRDAIIRVTSQLKADRVAAGCQLRETETNLLCANAGQLGVYNLGVGPFADPTDAVSACVPSNSLAA